MGVAGISHQTDEELELYALGRLPEPRCAEVEEHLLVCVSCSERMDELEAFALAMRQAIAAEPDPKSGTGWFAWLRQPPSPWTAAFGVIVLAVGLYVSLGRSRVAPLASLQLTALRGDVPSVAPARETDITLNLEADTEFNGTEARKTDTNPSGEPGERLVPPPVSPTFRMEVVDSVGGIVWKGSTGGADALTLGVKKQLAQGEYFVRLYDSPGKLLHEYAFRVRGAL